MNKTLALIAALGIIVSVPAFADDTSGSSAKPSSASSDTTTDKTDSTTAKAAAASPSAGGTKTDKTADKGTKKDPKTTDDKGTAPSSQY